MSTDETSAPLDLDAIAARTVGAALSPWSSIHDDVPALIDEVRRLRAALAPDTDLRDRIAEALADDIYVCTRVWEAWQHGTMTADDFEPASMDDNVIERIMWAIGDAHREAQAAALETAAGILANGERTEVIAFDGPSDRAEVVARYHEALEDPQAWLMGLARDLRSSGAEQASSRVDNASRPWDATDDAGHEHRDVDPDEDTWRYCGRGPCVLRGGHRGPCAM